MAKAKKPKRGMEELLAHAAPANGNHDPNVLRLNSGVRLRVGKFPKFILADSLRAVEDDFGGRPQPPQVFLEDKGRTEDNPEDPDYQARLSRLDALMAQAFVDVLIMHGTTLDFKPKSVADWNDREWLESLRAIRITPPEHKLARYTLWVKHVAARTDEDMQAIIRGVSRLVGVSEQDVSDAVDNFRGDAARDAVGAGDAQ